MRNAKRRDHTPANFRLAGVGNHATRSPIWFCGQSIYFCCRLYTNDHYCPKMLRFHTWFIYLLNESSSNHQNGCYNSTRNFTSGQCKGWFWKCESWWELWTRVRSILHFSSLILFEHLVNIWLHHFFHKPSVEYCTIVFQVKSRDTAWRHHNQLNLTLRGSRLFAWIAQTHCKQKPHSFLVRQMNQPSSEDYKTALQVQVNLKSSSILC